MKMSEQRLDQARRQYTESVITRHLRELFRRLPMLEGFCFRTDLEVAEVTVLGHAGTVGSPALRDAVMQSLVELAELKPEAVQLMRGRTFARIVH